MTLTPCARLASTYLGVGRGYIPEPFAGDIEQELYLVADNNSTGPRQGRCALLRRASPEAGSLDVEARRRCACSHDSSAESRVWTFALVASWQLTDGAPYPSCCNCRPGTQRRSAGAAGARHAAWATGRGRADGYGLSRDEVAMTASTLAGLEEALADLHGGGGPRCCMRITFGPGYRA